jgi:hypothetical protein
LLKAPLIHINKVDLQLCLHPVDVLAPLPQPLRLQRHIQIFLPFGFDNDKPRDRQLDLKIRVDVGNITAHIDLVHLEMHRQIIFSTGNHIVVVFQEAGEGILKLGQALTPGLTFPWPHFPPNLSP